MLKINEIFGKTIQGEGKSAGLEVTFIRTATCNLYCIWCDTKYTWEWNNKVFEYFEKGDPRYLFKKGSFDPAIEVHEMEIYDVIAKVQEIGCKAIVISGGEPLLQHKQLTPLIKQLKSLDNYWIEVETNGTIYPNEEFLQLIDQINCSPKLENSGNKKRDREQEQTLTRLGMCEKVNFKFVVSSEKDIQEILYLTKKYSMKDVYLMPLGMTIEELALTTRLTKDLCQQWGFKFSDRIHVTLLGGGRGV